MDYICGAGAGFVLLLREIYKSGKSLFFSGECPGTGLFNLVDLYNVSLAVRDGCSFAGAGFVLLLAEDIFSLPAAEIW